MFNIVLKTKSISSLSILLSLLRSAHYRNSFISYIEAFLGLSRKSRLSLKRGSNYLGVRCESKLRSYLTKTASTALRSCLSEINSLFILAFILVFFIIMFS